MSLNLPHKHDFKTNSDLPGYLTENAKALEREDAKDDQELVDEIEQRKKLQRKLEADEQLIKKLDKELTDVLMRLKQIEKLLFGSQSINATSISTEDEYEHQGYEITDTPDYDYKEREIN